MRLALTIGLFFACVTPALAAALTAEEAKETFFGFDMAGYVEGTDETWRECIKPTGRTVYWHDGIYQEGTLRIRDDAMLCFSYPDPETAAESCFSATRVGSNWRFEYETQGGSTFITSQARMVKACPTGVGPTS